MAKALESGQLQPKPDSMVVGEGLESIQLGLDTARKGVSATKVVVHSSIVWSTEVHTWDALLRALDQGQSEADRPTYLVKLRRSM